VEERLLNLFPAAPPEAPQAKGKWTCLDPMEDLD
jgi:hypothetical protein